MFAVFQSRGLVKEVRCYLMLLNAFMIIVLTVLFFILVIYIQVSLYILLFFHRFFWFHLTFRLKVIGSQSVQKSCFILFPFCFCFLGYPRFHAQPCLQSHIWYPGIRIPLLPADVGVLRSCLHVQHITESSFSPGPVFLAQSTSTLTFLNALHKQRVFFSPFVSREHHTPNHKHPTAIFQNI